MWLASPYHLAALSIVGVYAEGTGALELGPGRADERVSGGGHFDAGAPVGEVACYPPEADFVVRSRRPPESVHTSDQFAARRAASGAAAWMAAGELGCRE